MIFDRFSLLFDRSVSLQADACIPAQSVSYLPACHRVGAPILSMIASLFDKKLFAFLLPFCVSTLVYAQADLDSDIGGNRFSLKGFGTLGVARSSDGNASLQRDISQSKGIGDSWSARNDSVFGLQADYQINDAAGIVVQGVSNLREDGSYKPSLSWAFLKYDVTPRLSLRLGRVGMEFLMQADSRMVGYSYLPVRPAIDFYGIVPIHSGDGVDARFRWPVGNGIARLEGFAGFASADIPQMDLKGSKVLKGSLGYDIGAWQFRYIYAQAKLAENINGIEPLLSALNGVGATTVAQSLQTQGEVSQYQSIGVAYDDGDWQVQAAVNSIRHESLPMDNSHAATFLAGRRFGSVSPYIGYTWAKSSRKSLDTGLPNPWFSTLNAAVTAATSGSIIDRQTTSIGVRWDFARNMDLKAQVDFIRGSKSTNLLLADKKSGWDGNASMFSLAFDFVF